MAMIYRAIPSTGSASSYKKRSARGPYPAYLQSIGMADTYVREHAQIRENMGAYTTVLSDEAYCDNWLSENGLRLLRDFPENYPWHPVVNFTGPHGPMDVTVSMRERWEDAKLPSPVALASDWDPAHREMPWGAAGNRQLGASEPA